MNAEENVNDALHQLHRGVTEAATIAVGLGVLGVNRMQVVRREVQQLFCDVPAESPAHKQDQADHGSSHHPSDGSEPHDS